VALNEEFNANILKAQYTHCDDNTLSLVYYLNDPIRESKISLVKTIIWLKIKVSFLPERRVSNLEAETYLKKMYFLIFLFLYKCK